MRRREPMSLRTLYRIRNALIVLFVIFVATAIFAEIMAALT